MSLLSDVDSFTRTFIPVYSWIEGQDYDEVLTGDPNPKTLTDMFSYFLYDMFGKARRTLCRSKFCLLEYMVDNLIGLGKLAFEGLENDTWIFYKRDLDLRTINIEQKRIFSSIFTFSKVQNEEAEVRGECLCFVHRSVQEYFAALYVYMMFYYINIDVLTKNPSNCAPSESAFYKNAIQKALQCSNGHYDMFLRFLLGFSQDMTRHYDFFTRILGANDGTNARDEIFKCIKDEIIKNPDKSRILFLCLNELEGAFVVQDIRGFLRAAEGRIKVALTPPQWTFPQFALRTSEEELKEFRLGKYAVKTAQIENLSSCGLSEGSCGPLSSVLGSSMIQELDLSFNLISDSGAHSLYRGLAHSRVHTLRLQGCGVGEAGAGFLSSHLSSPQCQLKTLDLSDNECGDAGAQSLSEGLSAPHCPLQVLKLSLCRVTERGCMFLASALNVSDLKELDLSYNHPGQGGVQLLRALLDDPLCSLTKLSVKKCGESRIGPGPKKYAVDLTLDPNTSHKDLSISDQNRAATRGLNPPSPDSRDRFDFWRQVLGSRGLTGRRYWETRVEGRACIGVAYGHMRRKGEEAESRLGQNDSSWGLNCNKDGFKAVHDAAVTPVPVPPNNKIGIFLDFYGGKLSFFSVLESELRHIFTFRADFTHPVYPAFHLSWVGSSVHLC